LFFLSGFLFPSTFALSKKARFEEGRQQGDDERKGELDLLLNGGRAQSCPRWVFQMFPSVARWDRWSDKKR